MKSRIALLLVFLVASQMLAACNRVVSVEPMLADLPASEQRWEGAYLGTIEASEKRPFPMLLQLQRGNAGAYRFTIHARGIGQDIFTGKDALNTLARGEVRIVDLGDNYAVAQTRCEVSASFVTNMPVERRALVDMVDLARRLGTLSKKVPHSDYLGPYVYGLLRGGPAHPETVLGLDTTAVAVQAAQGTKVDVDKWEAGVGDGLLVGAGLVFESDDIHIANRGGPDSAPSVRQFFGRLARIVFSKEKVSNSIVWEHVAPERLQSLRFSDRFPAPGQVASWCNLLAALPKEK